MRTSGIGFGLCLSLGIICVGDMAYGQAIPQQDLNIIEKEQDKIQRRNETQRRLIELKNKSGGKTKPQVIPAPDNQQLPAGDTCFQADEIILNGVTLLDEGEQAQLLKPYLGNCITLGDVDKLLKAITNLYTEKGYVAARGGVPAQDISDGSLELTIVEGHVEGYELHGEKGRKSLRLRTAFPFTIDQPLNLRDIEQGLDQINRLKSNNAQMKLEPGSNQGATLIKIENQSTMPWHLTTGYDNSGNISTGVQQWTGTAELDDLIGINDYLSFSWSKDTKAGQPQQSRSLSGYWSLPFGYWTLSGSHSFYSYASQVNATTASYVSSGYSRTQKFELDWVAHRDQDSKTSLSTFLRQHTAASFVDNLKLDSSSYRLTSFGINPSYEDKLWGGIASVGITYEKGIKALNADQDEGITDPATPRAQFHKAELDLSYYKPFKIGEQNFTYNGTAHAQWSPMTLYSTDQISIGGTSSVRGFKENTLGGDQGAYLQNTFSYALPQTGWEKVDKVFGTFSPFVGYDIGALENDEKDATEKGVLSGYAFGIKSSGGYLNMGATYARPMRSPVHLDERHHELHLNIEMSF
ncbi:ShlB/FhaC/HecB family hemolysin secretion/activation protein [Terasakiella sp. A23]|uniref:ShlB/FhaC/HecB family hemolysin secretion/activation protein n=1 Tax=Terasakiella sp. FCG-A23 TaxID=3080561 RepID=UPI0029543AF8|nr:ShlB/FhaC/HecB family hemolysin secretion/activation protein [Terasakiella sp. A23]MDV7341749.1 ShlB/FhaC/HecB family hemolysin secretion/activation protein [Terasakiella sp. A23]